MGGYKSRPSGGLGLLDVVLRYTAPLCDHEQGLGYAFSCCSAVARGCDMGSFEGRWSLSGGWSRLSRSTIPLGKLPPHY